MAAYVYILHSKKLSRFYVGSTELPVAERLKLHLGHHYGNSKYTAKADDWQIFIWFECRNISQARRIEHFIKKQKSTSYIERLNDDSRQQWLFDNL